MGVTAGSFMAMNIDSPSYISSRPATYSANILLKNNISGGNVKLTEVCLGVEKHRGQELRDARHIRKTSTHLQSHVRTRVVHYASKCPSVYQHAYG